MLPPKRFSVVCVIVISLTISSAAFGQAWSGILDTNRAVDWTFAGIPGGIPSGTWTQCGPTIQPYGTSGSPGSPSTILNALNHTGSGYTSCAPNTYIQLGAGTFFISSGIRNVGVSNTELRGMGAGQTKLVFSGGSTCQGGNGSCLIGFESSDNTYPNGPPSHIYNWTSGYSKGATTITLSSGSNIVANSTMLVLDQCETGYSGAPCVGSAIDNGNFFNCGDVYRSSGPTGCAYNGPSNGLARPHRFQWEIVEATSCSPACGSSGQTTVTITPPLQHPNWAAGNTPQVWLIQPSRYVGVRDLTIDGSATTATAGISFYNSAYVWARGVAVLHSHSIGIYLTQVIHGVVESSYVFDPGQGNMGNDPSAINYTGSNNLIVNNINQSTHVGPFGNGPVNGNVVAYNFITNAYTGDSFMFGGIWDGHSNGADYNLFEGNVVDQFFQDQIHGTHLMETLYRNFVTGFESCATGNCGSNTHKDSSVSAIDNTSYNRYGNFVGNVVGTPGVNTAYQSSTGSYVSNYVVWVIGSGNGGGGLSDPIPLDPLVGTTDLRWGNWDSSTNATQWNTAEVPSSIPVYRNAVPTTTCTSSLGCPPSFYLATRPTWWDASIPFPAIGPDVTSGNVGKCNGTLNTPGQFAGVAATSSSQCTGSSLGTGWAGHINAIPAMNCYLNILNGPPDGSGGALAFDADTCYGNGGSSGAPAPPTGLQATVQ